MNCRRITRGYPDPLFGINSRGGSLIRGRFVSRYTLFSRWSSSMSNPPSPRSAATTRRNYPRRLAASWRCARFVDNRLASGQGILRFISWGSNVRGMFKSVTRKRVGDQSWKWIAIVLFDLGKYVFQGMVREMGLKFGNYWNKLISMFCSLVNLFNFGLSILILWDKLNWQFVDIVYSSIIR